MDLNGSVCVVTGAASGIGAALVRQLLALGAAGVVACDRDVAGVRRLAAIDETLIAALPGDVSEPDVHLAAVALAERRWGGVDLYCSNAGVLTMGGLALDLDDWQRHWDVNVLAHRHAAIAALPGMLERGRGWLLQTASAAGHLMLLDAPAYTATKHAAVGLAEWLHATYRHRGVGVSCICPLGVETPLMRGALAAAGTPAPDDVMSPEDVAVHSLRAVVEERFLVLPHPEVGAHIRRRGADVDRWVSLMSDRQVEVEGAGR